MKKILLQAALLLLSSLPMLGQTTNLPVISTNAASGNPTNPPVTAVYGAVFLAGTNAPNGLICAATGSFYNQFDQTWTNLLATWVKGQGVCTSNWITLTNGTGLSYVPPSPGQVTNAAAAVSQTMTPTNQISKTFYVSSTNSQTYMGTAQIFGQGTLTQPFYGDFDAIVNSQPAWSTGNLLPTGTNAPFWTLGNGGFSSNLVLKTGMVLGGYNGAQVVIKRSPTYASTESLFGSGNFITLRNIIIDGSMTNGVTGKVVYGAVLNGSYEKAEHCVVINWCGDSSVGESWGFYLGAQAGTASPEISDCTVSNCWGNYDDCYEADGSAYIHDNFYTLPVLTSNLHMVGVNFAYGVNERIVNNTGSGGRDFAYADTGGATNVTFVGNYGLNVASGVYVHFGGPAVGWTMQGLKVQGNTFTENTNYWVSSRGMVLLDSRETNVAWNGFLISGNVMGYACPGEPTTQIDPNQCSVLVYDESNSNGLLNGISVLGNTIDSHFPISLANYTGLQWIDNFDQNGNGYSNILTSLAPLEFQRESQNLNGPANPQNPLNAGLVLDLSFIEGTGTNVYNYASSYAITNLNFTPVCSMVGGAYLWSTGQVGYALSMTNNILGVGAGSFATFTNCLSYSFGTSLQGYSNMTVEVDVKQPAFVGGAYDIPLSLQQLASSNCFQLHFTATQTGFNFCSGTTNEAYYFGTSYADGNPHQLMAVYAGTSVTLYVDGVAVGSQAATGIVFPAANGAVSGYFAASRLNGFVSKAAVWTRALSPSEVLLSYRKFRPPDIGTTYYLIYMPTNTSGTHGLSGYLTNGVVISTGTY